MTPPAPPRTGVAAELVDASFFGFGQQLGHQHLHLTLELRRPYPEERLQRAVRRAMSTFPILGCRYEPRSWRDRWMPLPVDAPLPVRVVETPEGARVALRALLPGDLDPLVEPPWRVTQLSGPDATLLVVTVLHQLADAAGALAVVRELGAALHGLPPTAAWLPGEMPRSMGQILRALPLSAWPRLLWESARFVMEPLRYLTLARSRADTSAAAGSVCHHTVHLDLSEGSPLRRRCQRLRCTVNDLLVALLACTSRSLAQPGSLGGFFTVDLRRHLPDRRPRVANLSGIASVLLPWRHAASLDTAAPQLSLRIGRLKRSYAGLPPLLSNFAGPALLPHAWLRPVIRLWMRWARWLLHRGLLVTNIGRLDPYVQPFGDDVTGASLVGPWLAGLRIPIIAASGFRGRVTLQFMGDTAGARVPAALAASRLAGIVADLQQEPPPGARQRQTQRES